MGSPVRLIAANGERVGQLPHRRRKGAGPAYDRAAALFAARAAHTGIKEAETALASIKALLGRPLDPVTVAALVAYMERELSPARAQAALAVSVLEACEP